MDIKLIKAVLVAGLILVFGLTGCNAKYTKYDDETGKKAEVIPQDVAVVQSLAPLMEKCKDNTPGASLFLPTKANDCASASGVTDRAECFRSNKDIATMNVLGMALHGQQQQLAGKKPTCADSIATIGKAYFLKEGIQAKSLESGAKSVIGGTLIGLGIVKGAEVIEAGYEAAGGNTNYNNSRVANGQDSSASGDGDLGSGVTATDGSAAAGGNAVATQGGVDKNQNFPVTGDSNLDGSGDPSAPAINDADDIQTDVGLIP